MNKIFPALSGGVFVALLMSAGTGGSSPETGAPFRPESQKSSPAIIAPSVGARPGAASGLIPAERTRPEVETDFGKMPVWFVPNQGQMDERVAYYVQGKDKSLYFSPEGLTIALTAQPQAGSGPRRWAVKLDFVGASGAAGPVGENETGAIVSYFKGKPETWKTGLPTYSKIVYRDLWPGIDLVYQGTVNRLKYEFVVRPGADPSRIRLAYRGVDGLSVDEAGRLNVTTPLGGFQDDTPVAYQEKDGKRADIALAYEIDTPAARHVEGTPNSGQAAAVSCEYGFKTGDYDRTMPLVLDPALLVYCGYVGGAQDDAGHGIAVDGWGNVYITGWTASTESSFPVTVGPDLTYDTTFVGGEAFVAKINAAGTALVYCGYIGGSDSDAGVGIAVDAAGNAYVTGETDSGEATFPVTTGPDLTFNGDRDGFVAKINAQGTALVYCGYIGGSYSDYGYGIAVDGAGNAYVTGRTASTESTFPATVGPDLTYNGAPYDAFVAKIDAAGKSFVYCGYIGGSANERGEGIAVDGSGNVYVTGYTQSTETTFPVAEGPDLTHNGTLDAFVAKVNPTGTALIYCGYIGGSNDDYGLGIAVDGTGSAYVAGYTSSTEATFPVTAGPDLTQNGNYDAFVAKVNAAGTACVYCGYIGGVDHEILSSIALDGSGNAYVAGTTVSTEATFPVTGGPDLTINDTSRLGDVFVAKVNAAGTAFVYCGYIGGSSSDSGAGIAVDRAGNAYVTGITRSTEATFPVTAGPDLTFNGSGDAFVAKISYFESNKHAVGDVDGDGKDEVAVDFGAAGIWLYDQGAWSQIAPENPESLLADRVDPHYQGDILASLGSLGLWTWHGGAWSQMSRAYAEGLAAGLVPMGDGNVGERNLIVDFGGLGLWLWPAYVGVWHPLSGANADQVITAELGPYHPDWIIGDFGSKGLWAWDNSTWSQRWIQLSGLNPVLMIKGRWGGGERLIADFGSLGLWSYTQAEGWGQLTAVNADFAMAADTNGDGQDEIVGDFGLLGLWLWNGQWTEITGADAEYMMAADVTGDGSDEAAVDFGPKGLWVWNDGAWSKISPLNPEYLLSADTNGDGAKEILADFGAEGLWLWNGAWTRLSEDNPD